MSNLLLLGFLIGMRHALEADHVVAVATLTTQSSTLKQAVKIGSIWGLGHTLTLLLFGSVVLLTNLFIPETTAKWLEFCVGIILLILGLDVLRRLIRDRIHYHAHQHLTNQRHFHAHSHANGASKNDSHLHGHSDNLTLRALFVGVLHGMAGSAALILLTMETVKSPIQGMSYIALFGIGSIAGMAVLSCIISVPIHKAARGMTRMHNSLQFLIGSATIALGGIVIFENTAPIL